MICCAFTVALGVGGEVVQPTKKSAAIAPSANRLINCPVPKLISNINAGQRQRWLSGRHRNFSPLLPQSPRVIANLLGETRVPEFMGEETALA
jgi:hypothetical protein